MEIQPRHIQNFSDAAILEPHWGYADRALPCTSDPATCEYLDGVYHSHDLGMLYVGIFWATLGGLLLIWAIARQSMRTQGSRSPYQRLADDESVTASAVTLSVTERRLAAWRSTLARRNPLPFVFGEASRLQVTVLAVLAAYLTLWSFLGIQYKTWRHTPVSKHPGVYQTRTALGPWADRVGTLAFALLPFSILLSSRESLLSLITGIPYQHFNFLHRWLGHIIMIQAVCHTIGWCIIEIALYQPQPEKAVSWITETYMIWGVVALILLLMLWVLALPVVIRRTGYEFFRKAHYLLAMVFIGACIGHWKQLECFLIPALALWFCDRAVRLFRTFLIHYHPQQTSNLRSHFSSIKARATVFADCDGDGDIVRLDFEHANPASSWSIGQHFFLTFPESSIWQSHPFTPATAPVATNAAQGQTQQKHCFIFRAQRGETRKVAEIARAKEQLSVVLSGPYGRVTDDGQDGFGDLDDNILCVAGGTGITFALPVLLGAIQSPFHDRQDSDGGRRRRRHLRLVWVVRHRRDAAWLSDEIDTLRRDAAVDVVIVATRDGPDMKAEIDVEKAGASGGEEADGESTSAQQEQKEVEALEKRDTHTSRPDIHSILSTFVDAAPSPRSRVYASGPGAMLHDLRESVARCNEGGASAGGKVVSVRLFCDDRLEW